MIKILIQAVIFVGFIASIHMIPAQIKAVLFFIAFILMLAILLYEFITNTID